MRRLPYILLAITWALVATLRPPEPARAAGCQFRLGFADLHALIPDTVGDCVADETHNPQNGDAVQQTTHGLLVWRKADNWTAFTDGSTTWINGPRGLASRPNDSRFDWEVADTFAPLRALNGAALAPPPDLKPFSTLTVRSVSAEPVGTQSHYAITYDDPAAQTDTPSSRSMATISGIEGSETFDVAGSKAIPGCEGLPAYCTDAQAMGGEASVEYFNGIGVGGYAATVAHRYYPNTVWSVVWYVPATDLSYTLALYGPVSDSYGKGLDQDNVQGARALADVAAQLVPQT